MADLEEQVKKGVGILRRGGVVAFPTDTVYGLGADVFNPGAVERIYLVKKRPRHLPLPLLIGDMKQLAVVAEPLSEVALFLAQRFWPGGLTLVLPKASGLPAYLGGAGVAVRLPAHPVCRALIRGLGSPITGTSANVSGKPSALTAGEVREQLGNGVDLIIDGGRCPGGVESTVVDLSGEKPAILRRGIISEEEIDRVVEESGLFLPPLAGGS